MTNFSDLYELVRVATGNDDPTIGSEVMPDSRCDVLIRTAAMSLPGYSPSFEAVGFQQDGTTFLWELYPILFPTADLQQVTKTAIALVAAHRYYVGLGNKIAAEEQFALINDFALVASGEPIIGYKALGVIAEKFQIV